MVEIFVTVLSSDGDPMSSSIICASAALADAGIELYDNVVACTAVFLFSFSFSFYHLIFLFYLIFSLLGCLEFKTYCRLC